MNQRGPKHACIEISPESLRVSCPICSGHLLTTEVFVPISYKDPHTFFIEGICFTCKDRNGKPGRYRTLRYRQAPSVRFVPPQPLPVIGAEPTEEEIHRRLRKGDFEGV